MNGLAADFQTHISRGKAAWKAFKDHLPMDEWRETAATSNTVLEDVIYDAAGARTDAWSVVRKYLEDVGYDTRKFHDEWPGDNEDPWYWPDGAGTWTIVGPDGSPWDGPVLNAFFDAAREDLTPSIFRALFPRTELQEAPA